MTPHTNKAPLQLGSVVVNPPTILAPMEAITDAPFRQLVRSLGGCGLVVTEFVHSRALAEQTAKAVRMADIQFDTHPVSIQIYGRDPILMARSALLAQELGADIVDINMGCPSKAVTSGCAGVALMREPQLARTIVREVMRVMRVPLTVKMRLGWDAQSRNAPDLAWAFQEEGVSAITVHGRTRADLYRGHADWQAIGEVKARVRIPVIGNGDVCSVPDALEMLRRSGADAVMAGRGVLKNPWLLLQISQALRGEPVLHPSLDVRKAHLLRYFGIIQEQIPHSTAALGKMKKVAGIFTDGLAFAADFRDTILHARSVEEALEAVETYFARLHVEATALGQDPYQRLTLEGR